MNKPIKFLLWVSVWWLVMAGVVLAQGNGGGQVVGSIDVTIVLAPLAAAALGIERLLETLWGVLETVMDMLGITPDGEKYQVFKTWASAALGIVIGIIISSAAHLRMFGLLGLAVNVNADIFITGLVVGSGSKFTHDIIGIIYEGKRGLEQWRKLTESRRAGNAVE